MFKVNDQNEELGMKWLLNFTVDFPISDLHSPNMRPIKPEQFGQLKQTEETLNQLIFTYSVELGEFLLQRFVLMPNILIMQQDSKNNFLQVPSQKKLSFQENAQFLILSNCSITKKILQYKNQQAFGMILSNSIGNTYLFFSSSLVHRNWYKKLKQFCKLTGFLETYRLGEKIIPGLYNCVKRKNSTMYTVQIYKIEDFDQCCELEETVHNEIHMLRSIKHQNLLELKGVYESPKYLFIVYEFFKGESLLKLFCTGLQLHEVQVGSVLKFLNQHQFYHGSINPQNILINTQNQMLQITLINLSFKEYKVNDKLDWILSRSLEDFLAPEIFEGIAPSIQSDIYSVGCVLYFMSFFDSQKYKLAKEDRDYFNIITEFKIDLGVVKQKKIDLAKYKSLQEDVDQNKYVVSASQIDLLSCLLEPEPILGKRMTIKEATKHHWFLNVKNKIKSMKHERKSKKPLPSLRTIIELREQSEMDIRMTIIQQQQSGLNLGSRLGILGLPQQASKKNILKTTQIPTQQNQFEDEQDTVPQDDELNLIVKKFNVTRKERTRAKTQALTNSKNIINEISRNTLGYDK